MIECVGERERVLKTKQETERERENEVSSLVNTSLMTLIPLSRGSILPQHITCINI